MPATQPYFGLLSDRDLTTLRHLLETDRAAAEARDENGVSLLMHCLYRGHRDLADLIASQKTALDIFEASTLGSMERLRELARDSSAVNARSADGFTALHFACFFSQPDAALFLIKSGAAVDAVAANPTKVMPLHSAAAVRNLEAARLLLIRGAPANARQQNGWTPIHAAAQNGDRPMVELLLGHGADPKLANDEGKTPAMVAREKGHNEIAALLER
jgi:ankyrin repeat protein